MMTHRTVGMRRWAVCWRDVRAVCVRVCVCGRMVRERVAKEES
jgi:hypothetical protein